MKKRFYTHIPMAAVLLTVLSACGESDIEQIEQRELDNAQRSVQAQASATDSGTGTGANTGSNAGSTTDAGQTPEQGTPPEVLPALPGLDASKLELVFSEEFNDNALDANKWRTAQQWGSDLIINNELQYYVDSLSNPDFGYNPFSFDGESLTISAINTPDNLRTVANDQPYLSGVISSAGKFEMTYGYIEARMDFPAGMGLWPAFWMLSSTFEGLKPQLFIAEGNGAMPESIFHNYNYHDSEGNLRSPGQWKISSDDFAQGFHTLGVSWTADEWLFYVDGVPRYRIVGENVAKQPMYLIANLAVGGTWTGKPDSETVFPAELKIDYIRAYRHLD